MRRVKENNTERKEKEIDSVNDGEEYENDGFSSLALRFIFFIFLPSPLPLRRRSVNASLVAHQEQIHHA